MDSIKEVKETVLEAEQGEEAVAAAIIKYYHTCRPNTEADGTDDSYDQHMQKEGEPKDGLRKQSTLDVCEAFAVLIKHPYTLELRIDNQSLSGS